MTAVRIVLMMLMCLVTDAPGPITPLVFEHLEDGEEVRLARRQGIGQHRRLARMPSPERPVAVVAQSYPAPRPRAAARTAVRTHARKAPPPMLDPSASPAPSEDH
jgi:hypothetical protein